MKEITIRQAENGYIVNVDYTTLSMESDHSLPKKYYERDTFVYSSYDDLITALERIFIDQETTAPPTSVID